MSRVGKRPIEVPENVEVSIENSRVKVKGPKGELNQEFSPAMNISQKEKQVLVARPSDAPEHRSLHGLTRSLIGNMVIGVSTGFEKTLEITGVGYRAAKKGNGIEVAAGYSHPVVIEPIE